ncbi:MAG: zinc-dependent alcohol dehydrogenase [Betaproteobacteria bacterium]
MTESARAFWVCEPFRGELRDESLALPAAGEARIRTLVSGVSRGTETLVFSGAVPLSQTALMRCPHQQGEFPGPVKYGYSSVGVVDQGPEPWIGQRVFCLYPHQDRYVVPVASLVPVPEGVPAERAVLAANLETAINGLWDAAPRIGDRGAVMGAGVVGALCAALLARMPGVQVELIDVDARRAELARALGCRFAKPSEAAADVDLVVHASGHAEGLATALRIAGFESTVLELSWYGERNVSVPLGEAFHSRRLTIRSSQVGAVATAQRARWTYRRRLGLALDLLKDPIFDACLGGRSRFEDLPSTLTRLTRSPDGELCHRVIYD